MNNFIKQAIENGKLIILLGAGASYGSKSFNNKNLPLGLELAKELANQINEDYSDEELSEVYSAVQTVLNPQQIGKIFSEIFTNCQPSLEYKALVQLPIPRIYSLNIDDAFENAFRQNVRNRKLKQFSRNSRIENIDNFYETTQFIKLNGDANKPEEDFIFSVEEYGKGSASEPFWYQQLGFDFSTYNFLFIGTKLKEPLFYHQIEKYKKQADMHSNNASFIISPDNLSAITEKSLSKSNITHFNATFSDFITWLNQTFPKGLSSQDILKKNRPELIYELSSNKNSLFDGVFPVHPSNIKLEIQTEIKNFYKGFKPTWFDILKEIPAILEKTAIFFNKNFIENTPRSGSLFMLFGIAGSGKTTSLKQIALNLSRQNHNTVYYIEEYKNSLKDLIEELDNRNDSEYFIFIERPKIFTKDLEKILKEQKTKAIFISTENISIWNNKIAPYLETFVTDHTDISEISEKDADNILEKLKLYGNWTLLEKLSPDQRKKELLNKARSQLLIGLLEATSGIGYHEIILRDFNALNSEAERYLLLLSGIASTERVEANEVTIIRALNYLNIYKSVSSIAGNMSGVVMYKNDKITTRHRIYIEHIFENYVSLDEISHVIKAYIHAFSMYEFPINKSIKSRSEIVIFKHLVNFKFLKKILKNNMNKILNIYETFEKKLENEGLYLLQYGLALRSFNKHEPALQMLNFAYSSYNSPHILHALAQQKFIVAQKIKNESKSRSLIDDAVSNLQELIRTKEINGLNLEDDHYPIITLAEGHVKSLKSIGDHRHSKTLAKHYLNLLMNGDYQRYNNNPRFNKLKKYLSTIAY